MFWRIGRNLTQTLAFRLTVGYGGIAFLFALIAFSVFYLKLYWVTMDTVDEELAEEVGELVEVWNQNGFEGLKQLMVEESQEEESSQFYFSIFNGRGILLTATELPPWAMGRLSSETLAKLKSSPDRKLKMNTAIDGGDSEARIITVQMNSDLIFQHGQSIEDALEYLDIFQQLFWIVVTVSFLMAGLSGGFMARRALKGVDEVTRTATLISAGRFQERVAIHTPYLEINRLVEAFNVMVDRVQDLIQRMREITDNIAHDLRSPLTRIRGIAEMSLMSRSGPMTPAKAAENTIEECDNLIDMINTMLDLTEIEAGVQKFELEDVDVRKLLEEAGELFRPLAAERDITLDLNAAEGLHIRTDRSGLQRIVCNLLDNAIKYTPKGGLVSLRGESRNHQVVISVQDTGIGIASNDLPHIFDRFYRTDQSRSKPGNGLGLSLVKAITTNLGGSIAVKSRIDDGSTFFVNLPHTV